MISRVIIRIMLCLSLAAILLAVEPRPSTVPVLPSTVGVTVLGSAEYPLPDPSQDATAAIQAGLDQGGVVILPSGTWQVSSTLHLWKGVRLVGVGPTRPILNVPPKTFRGKSDTYVVQFCSDKGKMDGAKPKDADNDTFASGLMNLAIRISDGNPSAWAIRYRVAQLCIIEAVDLDLGSDARGIHEMANVIQDVHISGGRIGIHSSSPVAWQCLIADCRFQGQSEYSFSSYGCSPMIVRCRFADTPVAIQVPDDKNEMHIIEDSRFASVGTVIKAQASVEGMQILNLRHVEGTATPMLVDTQDDQSVPAPAADWSLASAHIGKTVTLGDEAATAKQVVIGIDPAPTLNEGRSFVFSKDAHSITDFGAVGDGETDCTAILQQALHEHGQIYLPPGKYRISDTITLKGDQALVGLHPRAVTFTIDPEAAGFADVNAPKPIFLIAAGSSVTMRGLGLPVIRQPGAIVVDWRGGAASRFLDIWSQWGSKDGIGPVATLLVSGGGTFSNLWLVNPAATHPLVIRKSVGPGRIELASLEHHTEAEAVIEDSSNWILHGLQTERGDSAPGPAIRMRACQQMVFGNTWLYRTSSSREPRDAGLIMDTCSHIDLLGFRTFAGSWKGGINYIHSLRVLPADQAVRSHHFAKLLMP